MITALLGLLHFGLGGMLRFVPEIIKFFQGKQDNEHEYRMSQLQLQIDQARAQQQIDQTHATAAANISTSETEAWAQAVATATKGTGVPWVDAISATVRPFVTYWWMLLFTAYKILFLKVTWDDTANLQAFVHQMWGPKDWAILLMILGFWFADRAIRKNTGV